MKKHSVLLSLCVALTFAMLGCGGTASLRSVNDPPPPDPPGGNSALHGDYALSFTGLTGNTSSSVGVAYVGRFTADGAGNLTNGEIDTNSDAAGHVLTAQSFAGNYSIGSDNRGFMTLNVGGKTLSLAIALTASGNAQFIELDASGGSGVIGSGTIEKADTSAYSTAEITGDYAFGADGFDNGTSRSAIEGRFTSNGAGTLTNGAGDINASGTISSMTSTSANYSVSDNAKGRGTMQMNFTHGGTADTLNFIFYVVNAGKLFVMETGAVAPTTPLLNGQVLRQQVPGGGFSNSSLNGNMVIALTGRSTCSGGSRVPKTVAGLLNTDGTGALSLTYDENFCSAPNSVTGATGTYSVASDGRAAMTIGSNNLVAYLLNSNQAFLFVSDVNVLFGTAEPQTGGALTNSSLSGGYAGFASDPVGFGVNVFLGQFSADGASPTGNLTGTEDTGGASGPVTGASFAATYSVTSSPTNGRGTVALKSPSGGNAIAYMVSPTKFVVVPLSDPTPALWVFESSSASTPPPVTLASLTLNPTTVVGGSSSTGTVTLSAAAPSGGAKVTLSSSNTSAAQTPSSVTVASGSTSATFTVTTSAVSASTAVTISAAFAGTTKTATLTVNPAAPPPVTLTSLSLSPTSVTGGSQNSTGTVTLSGAAPSGGAQVTLSSNNTGAAQTPSSVTVASGSTTATFTVSTSSVSSSTTVTISASFAGTTKSATLTVNPAAPPPVTLTSLSLSPTSVTGGSQNSTGTVTLSGAAPSGGAKVTLSSSNTGAAQTPSSVTVASGSTTATFTVTTSSVSSSTTVTISASFSGTTKTATLTVNPAAPPPVTLTSVSLNPTSVTGGSQNSTGTVTLSGAAPSGGAQVSLSSSNTGAAKTPASVTVASGSTTATFSVTTSSVSSSTTVTISASFSGTTKTATLTVNPAAPPPVTLTSLSLSPTSVTGGSQNSTGTVTLSGAAPSGGAQVTLSSNNTGAAQTPSSVTVASGSTTATFTVTTSSVSSSTTVTISASFSGATKTATLTVNPAPPPPVTLVSLSLNPTTVVGGVQSSSGTVTLSGPAPSGGAKVTLSSSSGAASVPSFVIVPAGATSASFTVNTSIVLITTSAVISATYNGDTQTASLSVLI